jgi:hypothetical protein
MILKVSGKVFQYGRPQAHDGESIAKPDSNKQRRGIEEMAAGREFGEKQQEKNGA